MKFALINGERIEATKGAKGFCPHCGSEVIAKCGERKRPHWAHKIRDCDNWKEGETEWHLSWKDQFPSDWQEVKVENEGNFHRADVKTEEGWVIEFQHSSINPDERRARNKFYKKIIWVVDGLRLKTSLKQFNDVAKNSLLIKELQIQQANNIDKCNIIKDWQNSNAPVFFDFNGTHLYLLFPKRTAKKVYISSLPRDMFIKMLNNKEFDTFNNNIIENRINLLPELEQLQEQYQNNIQKQRDNISANHFLNSHTYNQEWKRL